MVAAMPADTRAILLLTVRRTRRWIDSNNEEDSAICRRRTRTWQLSHWQTAAGQVADQLSGSDGGVHLRTKKAQQFYANMIFYVLGRSDLDQPIE